MTDDELMMLSELPGWCSPAKMLNIYRIVNSLSRRGTVRGVEIGVLGGRSLFPAALAIRDHSPVGGHIVGIDPYALEYLADGIGIRPAAPPPWPGGGDFEDCRARAQAMARRIGLDWVSLLVAPARRVAYMFWGVDYLHIDGNHTSDVALDDTRTWLPKVRPGGIVILDDCDFDSLQPARQLIAASCQRSILRVHRDDGPDDYEIWEK